MSKQNLIEKKSSKISLKRIIANLCTSGKNCDQSTLIDQQPIRYVYIKKYYLLAYSHKYSHIVKQ